MLTNTHPLTLCLPPCLPPSSSAVLTEHLLPVLIHDSIVFVRSVDFLQCVNVHVSLPSVDIVQCLCTNQPGMESLRR